MLSAAQTSVNFWNRQQSDLICLLIVYWTDIKVCCIAKHFVKGLWLGSREKGGFLALSWALLSDKNLSGRGTAAAAQRAHQTAISLWWQGEARRGKDKGDATWEVPKRSLYCQRRALPRARAVQGEFIAGQQATPRCSAIKTSAEERTHCRQERLAAKAFILRGS